MNTILIIFGLIVCGISFWDYKRSRSDTMFIDYFFWFEVSRDRNSLLFWLFLIFQTGVGIKLILEGVF